MRNARRALLLGVLFVAGGACVPARTEAQELSVRLIGNAGVLLSDGATSLLVDLPYEPGAFGYDRYDPAGLRPLGTVVSVITHDHRDHFDASLFLPRDSWRVLGPPSVIAAVPADRVLAGDSIAVGAFSVTVLPSPHTADHRSYRVRWRGRVLHFTGDTDNAASMPSEPRADVVFMTPWLQCALREANRAPTWDRAVLYHRQVDGKDEICGAADRLEQGAQFTLSPR